ncbi:16S rRNA (guanine(966)-N(2))-methyltransferase RsmD [Rhodococcus sp. WMMA185]|uniref:16S rRNA (guanine(966)-N(2))-methyltransferase RsmD n=1 Tax=Rhodococcus sp. WMMA185 TaxID=679318 RepID=UPI000878E4C6|nr:16S rRNA (guanine(966)-N(2))-methyltransferase RsmD [Rhodococcus sp. WMMA185]AOW92352.1 16S rRNA (guanine(966)-N(2))-methyltransferase RsmD [Rhodococcus sp. WMMA185]
MTRIIAGQAGGRRLAVPPSGTRPTSDRVREALFSALGSRMDFDGAAVLDLYAGSGALGLEALSRGAERALLVESDAKAARIIRSNVEVVGLPGAQVRSSSVASVLAGPADRTYDLVMADPPYAVDEEAISVLLEHLLEHGWVADDSIVVLERSSRSPETSWPNGFAPAKVKKYGETRIELATCYGQDS